MNEVHSLTCAGWLWGTRAAPGLLALVMLVPLVGPLRESAAAERRGPYVDVVQEVLDWEVPERAADAESSDPLAEQRDAILQSDAMLEALAWLDQYFAVQVDYSAEEVEAFRSRLRKLSPAQLRTFLFKLQQERAQRRAHRDVVDQSRERALMRSRAAAQRRDLPQWRPAAGFGGAPYHGGIVRSRPPRYRPYPPLINSRTVARLTVYRHFW